MLFFVHNLPAQDSPDTGHTPTMEFGNVKIDVKGSFEAEFNDNINFSHTDRIFDIILRPGVTVGVTDSINDNNTANLQMGLAWDQYLLHPGLSSYTNFAEISPDSKLAYTLREPPFTFSIYDSFNYSTQPSDALAFDPTTGKILTNIRSFGRFMNQIGVTGEVEMHNLTLSVGLYRYDVFPQQSTYDFLRRWQYTGSLGLRYLISSTLTAKLDFNYTQDYYRVHFENNSHSWYFGGGLNGSITKTITGDATIGFSDYNFLSTGSNGDSSQPGGITGQLSLTQKLSETKSHTITVMRAMNFGYVSNVVTVDRLSYKFEMQGFILPKMAGTFTAYIEHGSDSGGLAPEHYYKYVLSPSVNYAINKRSEVYASYEFAQKFSNFGARTYYRNQVILGLRYEF